MVILIVIRENVLRLFGQDQLILWLFWIKGEFEVIRKDFWFDKCFIECYVYCLWYVNDS